MKSTLTAGDLFSSRGRVEVLRVLWGVKVPMTAAEVARRTRMTHPGTASVLRRFVDYSLVDSSPAGRGHTYWLNRENVYVDTMLDPVFSAEREIPEMMLEAIRLDFEDRGAISIVLFGSYARGDQDETSDVDVMVVTLNSRLKTEIDHDLPAIIDAFSRTFGASLSVIVHDPEEASLLAQRAPGLYESLVTDGVCLAGLSIAEWSTLGTQ